MSTAFLIQTGASLVAIGLMVVLAAWAKIARPQAPLTEARARELLAEDYPDHVMEAVWLSADGAGALAKAGAQALVLTRLGDGWSARQMPWARAAATPLHDGKVSLRLNDVAAPRAVLALDAWPPKELAA
jgi:HAMP domain-containing protein